MICNVIDDMNDLFIIIMWSLHSHAPTVARKVIFCQPFILSVSCVIKRDSLFITKVKKTITGWAGNPYARLQKIILIDLHL